MTEVVHNYQPAQSAEVPSKAHRLVQYLMKLAEMRSKVVRDIEDYEKVLWFSDVPQEDECFTRAWYSTTSHDNDEWLIVECGSEPAVPPVPATCRRWVNSAQLGIKTKFPELNSESIRYIDNPDWEDGSEAPEEIQQVDLLDDFPDVQRAWENYVATQWRPWRDEHERWQRVHTVYKALFAFREKFKQLGEEYELVLGIGFLRWTPKDSQIVARHLLVANVQLEFEPHLRKFTVKPAATGAELRMESEMLQPEAQARLVTAKEMLAAAEDDPWDTANINGFLATVLNGLNASGLYVESLERPGQTDGTPRASFAPALILRKRSIKGLTAALDQIGAQLDTGVTIPPGFLRLAETESPANESEQPESGSGTTTRPTAVYFPLESNEEQERIVQYAESDSGVLVQGPPGTGKSHTIANLISHFLATGKRILITAKTPRALEVLQSKLPRSLQPLCISFLGDGQSEQQALESSVTKILQKTENWDEEGAQQRIDELVGEIRKLNEQKAQAIGKLRDFAEAESHTVNRSNGQYTGTAAQIARKVRNDDAKFSWFQDAPKGDNPCPFQSSLLLGFLYESRWATDERRDEVAKSLPIIGIEPREFRDLIANEQNLQKQVAALKDVENSSQAATYIAMTREERSEYAEKLKNLGEFVRRLRQIDEEWSNRVLHDLEFDSSEQWVALARRSNALLSILRAVASVADRSSLSGTNGSDDETIELAADRISRHLEDGKRIGPWPLISSEIKRRI